MEWPTMDCRRGPSRHPAALSLNGPRPIAPSHGKNRASSPLGSANNIKRLMQVDQLVSNNCPINVYGQAWTACSFLDWTTMCDAPCSLTAQILAPRGGGRSPNLPQSA